MNTICICMMIHYYGGLLYGDTSFGLQKNTYPGVIILLPLIRALKIFMKKNYNIKADFIHNAADFTELEPSAVNREDIKIVHHGLASLSRYLELMISIARAP